MMRSESPCRDDLWLPCGVMQGGNPQEVGADSSGAAGGGGGISMPQPCLMDVVGCSSQRSQQSEDPLIVTSQLPNCTSKAARNLTCSTPTTDCSTPMACGPRGAALNTTATSADSPNSAGSGDTNPNQGGVEESESNESSPNRSTNATTDHPNNQPTAPSSLPQQRQSPTEEQAALDRFWQQAVGNFWPSTPNNNNNNTNNATNNDNSSTPRSSSFSSAAQSQLVRLTDLVQEACTSSPCSPRDLANELLIEDPCRYGETADEDIRTGNDPARRRMGGLKGGCPSSGRLVAGNKGKSLERTYEEIEVDPTHHIQVRLPPQDGVPSASAATGRTSGKNKSSKGTSSSGNGRKRSGNSSSNNKKSSSAAALAAKKKKEKPLPLQSFELKTDEAVALERSISELTMRSSYATAQANNNIANSITPHNNNDTVLRSVPDKSRRMAYYAVGKHHRNAGRGGNRRCYFTGKLILGGAPFYAGSVQQGLRTLVVFCLPSAVGLPDKDALQRYSQNGREMKNQKKTRSTASAPGARGTILSVSPALRNGSGNLINSSVHSSATPLHMDTARGVLLRAAGRSGAASIASKSMTSKASRSALTSLDDLSLSIDGDLDPNWGLDRDVLLAVLPPADTDLLKQMADHYPDQFETLPVQVRQSSVWKLFVKFCFFSGLPIAEGEMHYKVLDDIAEQVYGEEIALSHEVLLAATGKSSADILTLPNRTVLLYLRKHYSQQCAKLEDRVFVRSSWERVAPEV